MFCYNGLDVSGDSGVSRLTDFFYKEDFLVIFGKSLRLRISRKMTLEDDQNLCGLVSSLRYKDLNNFQ